MGGCRSGLVGPTAPYPGNLGAEPLATNEGVEESVVGTDETNHTFAPVVAYSEVERERVRRVVRNVDRTGGWGVIRYNAFVWGRFLDSTVGDQVPFIVRHKGTARSVAEHPST